CVTDANGSGLDYW
nr:immunoglobulin heavy chain junction region [Macaca mulatta]MOV53615.1 immunoglobulin heavy chain junction region [Macaca mulatta]MOV53918.1 immunoglobulin heavy chain junction region [Macaca mulatta]MOV54019.1 immunoglobulin heavy chain junction region [Macaca mulatta]MOV54066.1 immunoglobulin heavy chain junction region [Macaca mulatta]